MDVAKDMRATVVGSGLAGLSAALTLADAGIRCRLVSPMDSRRSQSVMAEGGINGALDTMGDADSPVEHFADTMAGGVWLADPNAVRGFTAAAPELLRDLHELGMPFNLTAEGSIQQRYFGGQKKRRTAYAMSSTGKMLVETLNDACRRQEAAGMVERLANHEFVSLLLASEGEGQCCAGVRVRDSYTGEVLDLAGPVILASGGMNGMVPGHTTGTTQNTGDVTAIAFAQGVTCGNLEMIQFHPTTVAIPGKRCLISEAARGEGGRLYVERQGAAGGTERWYFMEERYPELGNLMPRDVVSREEWKVVREEGCGSQVYLDLTGLPAAVWAERLSDLRDEVERYLGIDPATEPVPVEPGIHYFMGGIRVDEAHRTNIGGLYAAGECCCQYHGANRLGGNSTLGAIYGGRVAAHTLAGELEDTAIFAKGASLDHFSQEGEPDASRSHGTDAEDSPAHHFERAADSPKANDSPSFDPYLALGTLGLDRRLGELLFAGLGIVRDERGMQETLAQVRALRTEAQTARDQARIALAEAWVLSALERRESRGAHFRSDFPTRDDEHYLAQTVARLGEDGTVQVSLVPVPHDQGEVAHA